MSFGATGSALLLVIPTCSIMLCDCFTLVTVTVLYQHRQGWAHRSGTWKAVPSDCLDVFFAQGDPRGALISFPLRRVFCVLEDEPALSRWSPPSIDSASWLSWSHFGSSEVFLQNRRVVRHLAAFYGLSMVPLVSWSGGTLQISSDERQQPPEQVLSLSVHAEAQHQENKKKNNNRNSVEVK